MGKQRVRVGSRKKNLSSFLRCSWNIQIEIFVKHLSAYLEKHH